MLVATVPAFASALKFSAYDPDRAA
jgi:hypothetical protein